MSRSFLKDRGISVLMPSANRVVININEIMIVVHFRVIVEFRSEIFENLITVSHNNIEQRDIENICPLLMYLANFEEQRRYEIINAFREKTIPLDMIFIATPAFVGATFSYKFKEVEELRKRLVSKICWKALFDKEVMNDIMGYHIYNFFPYRHGRMIHNKRLKLVRSYYSEDTIMRNFVTDFRMKKNIDRWLCSKDLVFLLHSIIWDKKPPVDAFRGLGFVKLPQKVKSILMKREDPDLKLFVAILQALSKLPDKNYSNNPDTIFYGRFHYFSGNYVR